MNRLSILLKSNKMMTTIPVEILFPEPAPGESPADFYEGRMHCKVLYLLHGATGDQTTFLADGIEALLRGSRTIVVMPYGMNSDFANHMEFGTGYRFRDFFFEELMPFVTKRFLFAAGPEDTYIAGYSMGGAGASMLGFYHPDRFAGIGVLGASLRNSAFLCPYSEMTGEEFRRYAEKNRKELPTEFGNPAEGITPKEINMIARYPSVRAYLESEEATDERLKDFADAQKAGSDYRAAGDNHRKFIDNCPNAIHRCLPELYFCCGENDSCITAVKKNVGMAAEFGVRAANEILPGLDHRATRECVAAMLQHWDLGTYDSH